MRLTLTSTEAKALLSPLTEDQIHERLKENGFEATEFETDLVYLGSLIQRGDVTQTKGYIEALEELSAFRNDPTYVRRLIQSTHELFYDGTLLHVALFWNTGQLAIDFAELLVSYGVEDTKDYYGFFPWEQPDGDWVTILDHYEHLGYRLASEFEDTYHMIKVTKGANSVW
jgi:hypothetical protein